MVQIVEVVETVEIVQVVQIVKAQGARSQEPEARMEKQSKCSCFLDSDS